MPCDFYKPKVYYIYKVVERDTKERKMKELTSIQTKAMNEFNRAVAKMNDNFCTNDRPDFKAVATIPTHPCYKEASRLVKALEA